MRLQRLTGWAGRESAERGGGVISPTGSGWNAFADVFRVLVRPSETFARVVEEPRFIPPLVFVMAASMASAVYAVRGGFMDEFFASMGLRSGTPLEAIEGGFLVAGILMALLVVPLVSLVESLFYMLAGRLAGGRAHFRQAFSVVCYASVPLGLGALVFAALMPVTHSPRAGANLAFLLEPRAHPLLWSVARQLDAFAVWFFILLAIAAPLLFGVSRVRARQAAVLFAVVYLGVMIWAGSGDARMFGDPYDGWTVHESTNVTLHHEPETPRGDVTAAGLMLDDLYQRCVDISGAAPPERIECYLYSSLEEKSRITGNGTIAHGVPWAGVVHVASDDRARVAAAREMMQVVASMTLGNVYNPLVKEGLNYYAGREWGGVPLKEAAYELAVDGALPSLERLSDSAGFQRTSQALALPASGAFAAYIAEEHGLDKLRQLYSEASASDVPLRDLLEEICADSLAVIERGWRDHVESYGETTHDAQPGGDVR